VDLKDRGHQAISISVSSNLMLVETQKRMLAMLKDITVVVSGSSDPGIGLLKSLV